MGLFDFFKKPRQDMSSTYKGFIENESLATMLLKLRDSIYDTAFVTTSRICPACSIYNRRVYSLLGRDKRFPLLPKFLEQAICPTCQTHIGYAHYFPKINGNLKKDMRFSNRPFKDYRTSEEKEIWAKHIAEKEQTLKLRNDFHWIQDNLPDLAPKSLAGYSRMVNSNSVNYKKIISAAQEKGYTI